MFKVSKYSEVKSTLAGRFQSLLPLAESMLKVSGESAIRSNAMTSYFKWWRSYRKTLEIAFEQDSIVVPAQKILKETSHAKFDANLANRDAHGLKVIENNPNGLAFILLKKSKYH
jgi:hypothetical protein